MEQLEQRQRRVWLPPNPILSIPEVAGIWDVPLAEVALGGVCVSMEGFGAASIPFLAVSLSERRGKGLFPTPGALDRAAGACGGREEEQGRL